MNEILKKDKNLSKLLPPQKPSKEKIYVPSQFTIQFEQMGKKYLFNTLTKQCLEADLPSSVKGGEGFDSLIEGYFLVPEGKDECAFYESISSLMRIYNKKKDVSSYTILPTLGCNARCVYCYEEGCKPITMTPEIVEQTIQYILDSHGDKKVKFNWFGGEPLLCQSIIDRICEGMRENGVEYTSFIISNGSLITPELIEKMVGPWHVNSLQISMDGAEEDYIKRKNYFTDTDQYHAVIRSIEQLAQKEKLVHIRCNVDENNLEGIQRFLEDLKEGISHKEYVSIYLAPLDQIKDNDSFLSFYKKMIDSRVLIEQAGFKPGNMGGFSLTFKVNFCMADGNGVVICPDGVLSPCEHLQQTAAFGDIWNGVTDEAAKKDFCRTDRTREKCRKCPFLPDCTSFASCPSESRYCREQRKIVTVEALKRIVQNRVIENHDDSSFC